MYFLILFLYSLYCFLLQYSALVLFCFQILPHNHSSQNSPFHTQIFSPIYTFHFVSITISLLLCLISAPHLPHGLHTSKGTLRASGRGISAFNTDALSSRKKLSPYRFELIAYLGNLIAKFLMSVMSMTDFHFLII